MGYCGVAAKAAVAPAVPGFPPVVGMGRVGMYPDEKLLCAWAACPGWRGESSLVPSGWIISWGWRLSTVAVPPPSLPKTDGGWRGQPACSCIPLVKHLCGIPEGLAEWTKWVSPKYFCLYLGDFLLIFLCLLRVILGLHKPRFVLIFFSAI